MSEYINHKNQLLEKTFLTSSWYINSNGRRTELYTISFGHNHMLRVGIHQYVLAKCILKKVSLNKIDPLSDNNRLSFCKTKLSLTIYPYIVCFVPQTTHYINLTIIQLTIIVSISAQENTVIFLRRF